MRKAYTIILVVLTIFALTEVKNFYSWTKTGAFIAGGAVAAPVGFAVGRGTGHRCDCSEYDKEILKLERQVEVLEEENSVLREENNALIKQISRLKGKEAAA